MKHFISTLAICLSAFAMHAQDSSNLTGSLLGGKAETVENEAQLPETENKFNGFSNVSATYNCWFDHFDKGYYGLRVETVDKGGFVYTVAFKGSWGITDPGLYRWRIGFGKAWSVQNWVAFIVPVAFMSGDYVKDITVKNDKLKYEKGTFYGLVVSPGIRVKLGGCVVGVSLGLGVDYSSKFEFYKDVEFSLGFKI